MSYYFLNLILIVIYALVISNLAIVNRRKERLFLIVSLVQLVLVRAFVNPESVPDLSGMYGYVTDFQDMANINTSAFWDYLRSVRYEPLYLMFVRLCSMISTNYHVFLGITAAFSIIPVLIYIDKYSVNKYLSLLVFVLMFFSLSSYVLRQFISVGILLFTYDSIIKRKFVKFLIITLLATLFHYSSIIWIVVYFLYDCIKGPVLLLLSTLLICSVVVFMSNPIEMLVGVNDYYARYTELRSYKMGVIHVFFSICYLFALRDNVFKEGINRIILISLLLGTIGLVFANYAERIYTCFKYVDIWALPLTSLYFKKRGFSYIYTIAILSLCFVYFYSDDINTRATLLFSK